MAKETIKERQERRDMERAVRLTIDLMAWLTRASALDTLGLNPREKEIVIMKWSYKLSLEQIAQNLSQSKERIRQLHSSAITKIYIRIPKLITDYPERQQLLGENTTLKQEIKMYKNMLDSLSDEKKQKVRENDIRNKNIQDIDFSKRTVKVLRQAGIETIFDLLEYNTTSLFALKGFGLMCMVEVEAFLMEHHLPLKRA